MTDEELLQAAAKAAGYGEVMYFPPAADGSNGEYLIFRGVEGRWNPLTDDGDALRLAVKRRIGVQCHRGRGDYVLADDGDGHTHCISFGPEGDPLASTRRAIVCVAALSELGAEHFGAEGK